MIAHIGRDDIRNKSDEELVAIYTQQIDYRPEVVDWVRQELADRQVDLSDVRVETPESRKANEDAKKLRLARIKRALARAYTSFVIPGCWLLLCRHGLARLDVHHGGVDFLVLLGSALWGIGIWRLHEEALIVAGTLCPVGCMWVLLSNETSELPYLLCVPLLGVAIPLLFYLWKDRDAQPRRQ